jgi:hypothetical protein
MDTQDKNIVGGMHGGKPIGSYIKTTLGKVYVSAWDSFENQPVGIMLEGDPRKKEESSIIDMWSQEENFYFRNKNKVLLQSGDIISYERTDVVKERAIEEFSDDELIAIINSKFFAFQKVLNTTTSVNVLFRIKNLAQDLEKSEKLMKTIDARISEVQAEEYKPLPAVTNVEL